MNRMLLEEIMKTLMKLGLVAFVLTVVALLSVGLTANAQGPQSGGPGGMMGWMGRGGPQNSLVAVAAKTLGMTQAELVAALQGGKTIADVAKDKGVALDKIVDAFVADQQESLKAAVTSGRMTQAQADSMLGFMKTNVLARLSQPFTVRGPGFRDTNNDGLCDGCGMQGGMRGRSGMWSQRGSRWGR
jgi:hypothetical protein